MSEVYSTAWLETARDKIVAQLNTLKTTMASGYDPTFSYVYDYHNVAKLQLNAVSVAIDVVNPDTVSVGSSGLGVLYPMEFTLRVHTAYSGEIMDGVKNARLLNSIINYLMEHKELGDGYRMFLITDITTNEEFAESATLGGECKVIVHQYSRHVQA